MSDSKIFKISDETRKRCKIFELNKETSRKFTTISLEFFHFLYLVDKIDFSIFVRVGTTMIEYMRKEEFSKELLGQITSAMNKVYQDVAVSIQKSDRDKFDLIIDQVRSRKLLELKSKNLDLDPKVLDIFGSISAASQMIVRGGINNSVVQKVKVSAAFMVSNLVDSNAAIETLSRMITCDPTLYDHSASVAMIACIVARNLPTKKIGTSEVESISQCALYHDVGKTCVPNNILNKPGKFTDEEFAVMKQHTSMGYDELIKANELGAGIKDIAARVALEHHEKFNGGGYPTNRRGRLEDDPQNGIHLYSRIVSIADVYSALLMKRVYKPAYEPQDAIKIMSDMAKDFDPDIFKEFQLSVVTSLNSQQDKRLKSKGRILLISEDGKLRERDMKKPA